MANGEATTLWLVRYRVYTHCSAFCTAHQNEEMMGRTVSSWTHSKTVASIWFFSAFLFFCLFQLVILNSSHAVLPSSDSTVSNLERRSKLYENMERDLDGHGAAFLKLGKTSQSLSLSDLFTLKDGSVTPVLKPANPPVRANVLYLGTEFSTPIAEVVKNTFLPYFDKVWFQNSSMYHFSMFHASHQIAPVPATKEEIDAEAASVQALAQTICPLNIVLDRVVLTSTGVLLGCWQVTSGTDPIAIRAKLRNALPQAPEKQFYDAAILHTSFARLLGQPKAVPMELHTTSEELQFFHELVNRLNTDLHGFKATVSELWYVQEHDLLALAINGRMSTHRFKLGCSTT